MTPQLFVFLGRSGCGKGTQVALLSDFLNKKDSSNGIFYVSTGEEFRKLIKGEEFTSKKLKSVIDGGLFAPSFLAVLCWAKAILNGYKEGNHMITDGSPRKIAEVGPFDTIASFYELGKPNLIFMNVSKEWATDKLLKRADKEGRADDAAHAIEKRMGEFQRDVVPVLDQYRKRDDVNFIEINGEQTIEKVHGDIMSALKL